MAGGEPAPQHYCHNCGWWETLVQGPYCLYCITWFYKHGRLPKGPHR